MLVSYNTYYHVNAMYVVVTLFCPESDQKKFQFSTDAMYLSNVFDLWLTELTDLKSMIMEGSL